ncbi:hypothetical protein [Streptomyces sp. NBC_00576]|uniref:hypothetical protein n=1 Tax=Streptomyces sp. NBC_00576 TaxID=2903665 RepID=UPI002E81A781|nr:hypothetical protein [Streptomyces sp. NBC_00576]WUB76314.1 hypothetical protein OG734_43230 [Streptomyces sp. NBC_00576]
MSGIRRDPEIVVTGAGQSPGREHALALAAEEAHAEINHPGDTAKTATAENNANDGTAVAELGITRERTGT